MGARKKEASRRERQGLTDSGLNNVKTKGENFYRSAKKVKTLNMFNEGKARHNAAGKVTQAATFQSRETPKARVEPHRKWFTNTRVISQDALSSFREAVAARAADPYQVLLKTNKLPMSLIRDNENLKNGVRQHEAKIAVESAPFGETFGPKSMRKRVKLGVGSLEGLAEETAKLHDSYTEKREETFPLGDGPEVSEEVQEQSELTIAKEPIFSKGQSKRIWNELYKVIDSSDVILHILDARDPEGTRCRSVEKYMREEAPHKHLVFVLNKCDLVPTTIAAQWVRYLSKEHPTLAFHASLTNSFGKGSLITLLRQFSILHASRKQISVGFIGYPNTGKSSIINTLRKKRVCTVAPIPGETKVWQYITLMKRIYLIDCPGVVPPSMTDTPEDILLRGVVRVENVANPAQYVPAVMARTQTRHLERTYEIKYSEYEGDAVTFLAFLARRGGRLLKGGEPDVDGVAKMVLNDFLRGKIPWFSPPPGKEREGVKSGAAPVTVDGREGRLGEMPGKSAKRKREDLEEGVQLMESGVESEEGGDLGIPEIDANGSTIQLAPEDSDSEESEGGVDVTQLDDNEDDIEDDAEDGHLSLGSADDFEAFESEDDEPDGVAAS